MKKDGLYFLPLGGSGEIGMNVNLYCYKGKWLMIDLGAGFADYRYPGIQMLAPDLSFVYENMDNFLGLVLTHGHEDHVGSVGYLWDRLRCPIYATPFTAAIARNKLREAGLEKQAVITELPLGKKFEINPFVLETIHVTHSIPEMNSLVIRTEYGNILHTGDWKFDDHPIVSKTSDKNAFAKLGDEGVLAMVCDSTNVFTDKHSGSEGDLEEGISNIVADCKGMVVVTTFASNVARMDTIAKVAKKHGRKVAITGLSLNRISTIARETGYLKDIDPFISDKEIKNHSRDKLLVICTGCQGETNAAMSKIADGRHKFINLTPSDYIIFSSKIIPGNEKSIFALFGKFVKLGVEVFTEKDHFVHVSGHPSRSELKEMYSLVKPETLVSVHGEPTHLHEHAKFAKECGISNHVEGANGKIIKLAPGKPEAIKYVDTGFFAVDGNLLHPEDGNVMRIRRNLQDNGVIFVTLAITLNGSLAAEPMIMTPGVLDEQENRHFIKQMIEELIEVLDSQRDMSDDNFYKTTRRVLRRLLKEEINKYPPIEIQIVRI